VNQLLRLGASFTAPVSLDFGEWCMQIRPYQETDEEAVIALWNESLSIQSPHNDPVRPSARSWRYGGPPLKPP
jgi:hypothetical protein